MELRFTGGKRVVALGRGRSIINGVEAVEPNANAARSAGGFWAIVRRAPQRALAFAICLLLCIVTVVAIRFGSVQGPEIKPFLPMIATIWAMADLMTAFLLFGQFYLNGRTFFSVLAAAYAISGLLTWPYLLAFPGVFEPGTVSVADQQISIWLWSIWHASFPTLVAIAVVCDPHLSWRIVSRRAVRRCLWMAIVATLAIVVSVTGIVYGERAVLPIFVLHGQLEPAFIRGVAPGLAVLNAAGCAVLFRCRRYLTSLHLWLFVAMFSAMLDCVLNSISASRYSYCWDIGKLEAVLTSSVVLAVLLCEVTHSAWLHKQLEVKLLSAKNDAEEDAARLAISAEHDRVTTISLNEKTRLMALAEQMAHIGHWRLDLATNELYWSDEMYRTFGLATTSQPTLQSAVAAYHPDDRDAVRAAVRNAIDHGASYTRRSRVVRADGSIRHVISCGQSERDADGTTIALFGIFRDITDTVEAERERERLLERVSVATRAAQVGIWEWDLATDTILWDPTMFTLYRFADAGVPLAYQTWTASLHGDDRARAERELAQSVASGTPWDTEFRVVWPGDEVRHIRATGTVVCDQSGRPSRVVGTNWDTTEVRTLSEQLRVEKEQLAEAKLIAEETSRAKSNFLANMSHEIRTPMNGIIGLTSLLLDGELSLEQRDFVTLLAEAGQSLLAIINDILDFSKVEAGKIELEAIALSPGGLIYGVMALVQSEALKKRIELRASIAPGIPAWTNGDPTRLRQILLNLLTNALKFTERGQVEISVRCAPEVGPDFLRFEISDTGIGIAPENQHLLFQTFSQVDRSDARKYGGSGLGLAISRRLAEAMSGTIGVNSVLGTGSVFWFTAKLPCTTAPSRRAVGGRRRTDVSAQRILVVDDNPVNQVVAKAMLVNDGHEVMVVANGVEAVGAVQERSFDLVFMDMQMPVMDGLEATRRIRALATPTRNVPIIALSANVMTEHIGRCHEAGMNDHLAKPIDRGAMRQIILRWTTRDDSRADGSVRSLSAAGSPDDPPIADPSAQLNMDSLRDLFSGNEAAITDFLDAAIESIRIDAQRIHAAIVASDMAGVTEAAHRLKGTCGELRANRLSEIASRIERESKAGPGTIERALLLEVQSAVDALSVAIELHTTGAALGALKHS